MGGLPTRRRVARENGRRGARAQRDLDATFEPPLSRVVFERSTVERGGRRAHGQVERSVRSGAARGATRLDGPTFGYVHAAVQVDRNVQGKRIGSGHQSQRVGSFGPRFRAGFRVFERFDLRSGRRRVRRFRGRRLRPVGACRLGNVVDGVRGRVPGPGGVYGGEEALGLDLQPGGAGVAIVAVRRYRARHYVVRHGRELLLQFVEQLHDRDVRAGARGRGGRGRGRSGAAGSRGHVRPSQGGLARNGSAGRRGDGAPRGRTLDARRSALGGPHSDDRSFADFTVSPFPRSDERDDHRRHL